MGPWRVGPWALEACSGGVFVALRNDLNCALSSLYSELCGVCCVVPPSSVVLVLRKVLVLCGLVAWTMRWSCTCHES